MATYVLSDIHGLQDRFVAMLELIQFQKEDTLYILGDVIDRGPDGIALLQRIRKEANMILLMGNHEHMMMQYYDAQDALKHGGDILSSMECIHRWELNHNKPTKQAFEALSKEEQTELRSYIKRLPLAFPDVVVNDRHFYLVHANWNEAFMNTPVYLEECAEKNVDPIRLLWDRIDETFPMPKDKILIFGHTVTLFYQRSHPYQIWTNHIALDQAKFIAIDCGCAANNEDTRLACIRLDDLEVFYV